jgi:hypothetical protein
MFPRLGCFFHQHVEGFALQEIGHLRIASSNC